MILASVLTLSFSHCFITIWHFSAVTTTTFPGPETGSVKNRNNWNDFLLNLALIIIQFDFTFLENIIYLLDYIANFNIIFVNLTKHIR